MKIAGPARILAFAALLLAGTTPALAETAGTAAPPSAPPPSIVASVPPIHSLVAALTEGVTEPVLLIPANASPHTFSLRPSDARALSRADIVVWVGPALETSLTGPLDALAGDARIVTLSDTPGIRLLPVREGGAWPAHRRDEADNEAYHEHDEADHDGGPRDAAHHDRDADHHGFDAHLWLDTDNAKAIVVAVAGTLIAHDPAHAATYAANRDAALGRLDALTKRLRESLSPVASRPFLVFHDGFQYFERQFELAAAGAIAISPDIRPGARRIAELREHLHQTGARCVFAEPQFDTGIVRTVAERTGARVGTLDPIGTGLTPGPDLYPRLMENLAAGFSGCLAADG